MCKSTQDLAIFLKDMETLTGLEDGISIQVFTDKSFRIYANGMENPIYDSENFEIPLDINDLLYVKPEEFAEQLRSLLEAEDISNELQGDLSAAERT